MLLNEKLKRISKALHNVNADMVTEIERITKVCEALAAEIEDEEAISQELRKQLREAESNAAVAEHDLAKEIEASEEARNLLANVTAETVGILDTSGMAKRILFEALAERWELLTHSQISALEEALK